MNARLLALAGIVAAVVALPLAVASAGSVGEGRSVVRSPALPERSLAGASEVSDEVAAAGEATDASDEEADTSRETRGDTKVGSPSVLGLGLSTAARCGPELASSDGIEAQTCVMTQGEDFWARTYYRNATGADLDAVLSLMGPGGRTVQIHCSVAAEDEPGTCETPREATRDRLDAYTAVSEFAARSGRGPLLLRSGSNSETSTGSWGAAPFVGRSAHGKTRLLATGDAPATGLLER